MSSPVRSLTNLARGTRSRCLRSFIASSVQLAGRGVGKTRCGAEFIRSRMCALRTGTHPQVVVTTTPRPIKLIKDLVRDPRTVLTRGSTWDNALNLASTFIHRIEEKYAGTRLGRQELEAEILEDIEGALWRRAQIEELRVARNEIPELKRLVIAVDPSVSTSEGSNETGMVFAARQRMVLGQVKVADKSNEIVAIPALLDMMTIEGAIVTIDAMGCQRDIAKKIEDKKAVDADHGRIETRIYTVIHDVAWL